MLFKNAICFRFSPSIVAAFDDLEAKLQECKLTPVGPQQLASTGFVSPFGRDGAVLHHRIGAAIWFSVGTEARVLPAAVVAEELDKKLAEIEQREGRRPGGKARKRLKEDVVHALLPRAFVKPSRISAYLDLDRGLLVVDTSSRKAAEAVASELRHALGSFPALPLNAEVSPRAVLTGWLTGEELPEGLDLGEDCEVRSSEAGGPVAKLQRHELDGDEVKLHLESGKACTRLSLQRIDHLSFTLGEDLVLRKLRFLDGAVESLAEAEPDSLEAELDARFAILTGEFGQLFDALASALKLSTVEAEAA